MMLGVLLAAGRSLRFGPRDKLLSDYRGQPLVLHSAAALRDAGCDALLAVISSPQVAALLPPEFARCRIEPGQPMSHSWEAAVRHGTLIGADHMLFALGDMPKVGADVLRRLMELGRKRGGSACVCDGVATVPACLPVSACKGLMGEPAGDRGARSLIARLPARALLPVSRDALLDVDTPDQLRR